MKPLPDQIQGCTQVLKQIQALDPSKAERCQEIRLRFAGALLDVQCPQPDSDEFLSDMMRDARSDIEDLLIEVDCMDEMEPESEPEPEIPDSADTIEESGVFERDTLLSQV